MLEGGDPVLHEGMGIQLTIRWIFIFARITLANSFRRLVFSVDPVIKLLFDIDAGYSRFRARVSTAFIKEESVVYANIAFSRWR